MLDINAYPMEKWTEDQWMQFHPICDGLEAHGYWVSTTPLEGQFDEWISHIKKALKIVEAAAAEKRAVWGYRGLSKSLKADLHRTLPEPMWGVEVHPKMRVTV